MTNESSPVERSRLAEIGVGAVFLVGLAAALRIVDLVIGKSPLAAAIGGAVLADVVAGLAGVRWDMERRREDKATPNMATGYAARSARRAGFGAALALAAAMATVLLGAALSWARVESGAPGTAIAFAILRSVALAVRDELTFRGIVLGAASRARVPFAAAAGFAALAGGASIALLSESSPGAVALTVASGLLFAVLWRRFNGAWAAIGAHAAWIFLVGTGLRGGLIDIAWEDGALAPGGRSFGGAAFLASAVFAALTAVVLLWKRAPETDAPPKQKDLN